MPDIRKVRKEAEELVRALDWEVYQNWAGLKPELNTSAIYAQHPDLLKREVLDDLKARRAAATEDAERRLRYLHAYLTSAFLANEVRELTDRHDTEEAKREVVVGHHIHPFRLSEVRMVNEDDRGTRAAIYEARNRAIDQINEISLVRWRRLHALAKELGYRDYAALFSNLKGIDFAQLDTLMTRLVDRTEKVYAERLERYLKPLDLSLKQAKKHDVAYVFRGKAWDPEFKKERAVATLKSTLLDLGFDLDTQANITIDAEERPNKSPRAFCVPAHVPRKVLLVVMPHGGHDDYATILHEAGHAEHYANAAADLPFEYKYLGDNSVTEGMAFALEYITLAPEWLADKVGLKETREFLDLAYTYKAYFLRRYAGKLRYEMQLHTKGLEGMAATYRRELERTLKFKHPREHYLEDLDDGFYAAQYLRAWILEAQMSQALREMFGDAWFREKEAGRFLKGIWAHGQKFTADELAKEFGYPGLDIDPLLKQVEEHLSAS